MSYQEEQKDDTVYTKGSNFLDIDTYNNNKGISRVGAVRNNVRNTGVSRSTACQQRVGTTMLL